MELYRVQLRPRSPWRTPWQADTLLGALCATAARVHGPEFLRARLIEPMLAGQPPFILSDAFPSDLLPIPMWLRLFEPTARGVPEQPGTRGAPTVAPALSAPDRKSLKRARWLSRDEFLAARAGRAFALDRLIPDSAILLSETTRHNTLSRESDASLTEADGGGGLFSRPDTLLAASPVGSGHLTLYFRTRDTGSTDLLLELLYELSLTGFGADIATGRGQFEINGDPVQAPELDAAPDGANGIVVVSTFQPAPGDPADGYWEVFPKFGKLGADLGLPDVRKNTLIMLRPGACFRADPVRPFLGRALPMSVVLPRPAASALRERGVEIAHPAFGLCLPALLPEPSS